jgi:hypothetical protein
MNKYYKTDEIVNIINREYNIFTMDGHNLLKLRKILKELEKTYHDIMMCFDKYSLVLECKNVLDQYSTYIELNMNNFIKFKCQKDQIKIRIDTFVRTFRVIEKKQFIQFKYNIIKKNKYIITIVDTYQTSKHTIKMYDDHYWNPIVESTSDSNSNDHIIEPNFDFKNNFKNNFDFIVEGDIIYDWFRDRMIFGTIKIECDGPSFILSIFGDAFCETATFDNSLISSQNKNKNKNKCIINYIDPHNIIMFKKHTSIKNVKICIKDNEFACFQYNVDDWKIQHFVSFINKN